MFNRSHLFANSFLQSEAREVWKRGSSELNLQPSRDPLPPGEEGGGEPHRPVVERSHQGGQHGPAASLGVSADPGDDGLAVRGQDGFQPLEGGV